MTQTIDQDSSSTIFIARQPIFNRDRQVYAYELLYRSDPVNRAFVSNDEVATLKVIANSLLIGLQSLTAGMRAFIHFNRSLLLGQIPLLFSKELLGVELFETLIPDESIIRMCERLQKSGYLMIMNDIILNEPYSRFLPFANIIKVDFLSSSSHERLLKAQQATSKQLTLLAKKIETQSEFQEALELGFVYFQGFFFQKPDLVSRREMPGYKLNYMKILREIHNPVLELSDIEQIIKRDVSLTYKLLRFINSASFGFRVTIRSVGHALMLLGKREIKKWLTIIVMSGIGKEKPLELMNTAVVRARFCELIAAEFKLYQEPAELFLMGMFSMMDAFLDRSLEEILEELPLEENVKSGLLGQNPLFSGVLELVKDFEKADWLKVTQHAARLKLEEKKIAQLYLEAVEWTKFLTKEERPPAQGI